LEESDLIPENKQSKEKSPNNNLNSEITDKVASSFEEVDSKSQSDIKSKILSDKKDTLFRRVIENGFDGITTNPNYKLLALLIILLINLSLFFVVGNIGKNFLRNSGILG